MILIPPVEAKVVVAVVKLATPLTEKSVPGVVVPIPTKPELVTVKRVVEAESTTLKALTLLLVLAAQTVNLAKRA